MTPRKTDRSGRALLIAAFGAGACAYEPSNDQPDGRDVPETRAQIVGNQGAEIPFVVRGVTASGSGCPPGSIHFTTERQPVSRVFYPGAVGAPGVSIKFDSFAVALGAGERQQTRDCALSIVIDAAADLAFAPRQLGGVADANPWSPESQTTTFAWAASPDDQGELRELLNGTNLATARWSGCGGDQELRITTAMTTPGHRETPEESPAATFSLDRLRVFFAARRCGKRVRTAGSANAGVAGGSLGQSPQTVATRGRSTPAAKLDLVSASITQSCPWTPQTVIAPDGQSVSFLFDSFVVPNPRSFSPTSQSCTLDLSAGLPRGKAVAIASVAAQGSLSLDAATNLEFVTMNQYTRSSTGDIPFPASAKTSLFSSLDSGHFSVRHEYAEEEQRFYGCNGAATVPLAFFVEAYGGAFPRPPGLRLTQLGPITFVMRDCQK